MVNFGGSKKLSYSVVHKPNAIVLSLVVNIATTQRLTTFQLGKCHSLEVGGVGAKVMELASVDVRYWVFTFNVTKTWYKHHIRNH